jgi:hypothetical protein
VEARTKAGIWSDRQDFVDVDDLKHVPQECRSGGKKSFILDYAAMFGVLGVALGLSRVNSYFSEQGVPNLSEDPTAAIDACPAPCGQIPRWGWDKNRFSSFLRRCGSAGRAKQYALDCLTEDTSRGDTPEVGR